MLIKLIPTLCSLLLLFTILHSIFIVVKVGEKSYQKRVYVTVMSFWTLIISFVCFRQIYLLENNIVVTGYLHCNLMIMGTFCQLSLIWYALTALSHKKINLKAILLLLSPAVLAVGANLLWNAHKGYDITHHFKTLEELTDNIFSVTVFLRFAMLLVQLLYMGLLIYSVKQLVPIYNKYLSDTQSNERYNLDWLHTFVRGICTIALVYFILASCPNYYTQILYCLVASYAFLNLTDCVWEYKDFPKFNEVKLKWSFLKGWSAEFAHENNDNISDNSNNNQIEKTPITENVIEQLHAYIIEKNLYANIDLTMRDLLINFPQSLDTHTLVELLAEKGSTFQSFIRDIRIEKSAAIMAESDNLSLYKEIYYRVGFSHYSSFSRAFTTVMGVSPSKYKQSIKSTLK